MSTEKRGRILKEWVENNNLCYIPSTSHSSDRSNRNIDLTFTNIGGARGETLNTGTSDHWPVMITCENVCFDKNKMSPFVNWKVFEAILALLQDFWLKQQSIGMQADEWYMNYVRFLAALKNRLTKGKEKGKFRPALPLNIIQKLKEIKRVRNKYYRQEIICNTYEETRVLLRVLARELRINMARYKSSKWQDFLSTIQETHDNTERAFWLHLSRVYKHRSLPLSKLNTDKEKLTKENEITDELYRYYEEQFKVQNIDMSNPHDVQIETDYLELMNKLELTNEKIEMTNVREIKQHISKMKPKNIIWLRSSI